MKLPPPCLTLGKTHLSLYSSPGCRHTRLTTSEPNKFMSCFSSVFYCRIEERIRQFKGLIGCKIPFRICLIIQYLTDVSTPWYFWPPQNFNQTTTSHPQPTPNHWLPKTSLQRQLNFSQSVTLGNPPFCKDNDKGNTLTQRQCKYNPQILAELVHLI